MGLHHFRLPRGAKPTAEFFPEAFIDEISILVVGDFFASASAACAPRVVREHTPLRGRKGHGEAWQWPLGARVAGVVGTGQHWA